jgi:hypothetical protein
MARFLWVSNSCCFVDLVCPLWWGDVSVICSCWWSLTAKSEGLMTIFQCYTFLNPSIWKDRPSHLCSLRLQWPSHATWLWISFSLPPATHRAATRRLEPASMREAVYSRYVSSGQTHGKHNFNILSWICIKLHFLFRTIQFFNEIVYAKTNLSLQVVNWRNEYCVWTELHCNVAFRCVLPLHITYYILSLHKKCIFNWVENVHSKLHILF